MLDKQNSRSITDAKFKGYRPNRGQECERKYLIRAKEFLPSRVEPYQKDVIFLCFYTIENKTFAVSIDGVNLIPASNKIFIDVTTFREPMRKKLDK